MASQKIRIARSANVLDERPGYRLRAPWGHLAVLEGGGHICELELNSRPGVNPLWRPQWTTVDPQHYSPARHRRRFGSPPDGRLLAGIAGHSISFDQFGPPSPEETAAGLSTHGEAPSSRWRRLRGPSEVLRYGCTLPQADLELIRTVTVSSQAPVIFCEEQARNLAALDRPVCWNEHVTFGPPFLGPDTRVDMPATLSQVCPASYSDRNLLCPDAQFIWPQAPGIGGEIVNLREMPLGCYGQYSAQLLDSALEIGFISAVNPNLGLLVVYAFRRTDFPWVGNWQESNYRTAPPWNGRTLCRGLEFSSTPFALPRRETLDRGPLFGERTYRWLPAKSAQTVRYVILLFAVPSDFRGIESLTLRNRSMVLTETTAEGRGRELSAPVGTFLDARSKSTRGAAA
ncbi:MAG: hypothetical protein JSR66_26565 [Proteobacteria bacterium]|nr:hypothetical protein [Pseudomonadota bacterium]